MKNIIDELYEMKEAVAFEIGEANKRIAQNGGKLSRDDLDVVDKLAHAMKSLATTCAMLEAEEKGYSGNYPMYSGNSYRRYERNGYAGDGYARRDYSRTGDMREQLRQMMNDAPDETTRNEIRRLMDRVENR